MRLALIGLLLLSGCMSGTGSQRSPNPTDSANIGTGPDRFPAGLASPQTSQSAWLGAAQIQQLLAGNTIKQVDDQYWAFYRPGGQLSALYSNASEAGSWHMAGDRICHRWNTWAPGEVPCFYVYPGQGAYRFVDPARGNSGFTFVVRRGNPQQL